MANLDLQPVLDLQPLDLQPAITPFVQKPFKAATYQQPAGSTAVIQAPENVPDFNPEPVQSRAQQYKANVAQQFNTGAATEAGVTPQNIQELSDYVKSKVPKPLQGITSVQSAPGVAIAKTGAGFLDWITSPSGLVQSGLAAFPPTRIPMAIQFIQDSAKGGSQAASDAIDAFQKGDLQGTADGVANVLASIGTAFGVGHAAMGEIAPKRLPEPSTPPLRDSGTSLLPDGPITLPRPVEVPSKGFSLSPEAQAKLEAIKPVAASKPTELQVQPRPAGTTPQLQETPKAAGAKPEILKSLGKDEGFTYDGEFKGGKTTLHQFTFRNLPKDDPALGATFYAKDTDTPEQIMSKARAKAKEFRDAAKPPEPVPAKPPEPTTVAAKQIQLEGTRQGRLTDKQVIEHYGDFFKRHPIGSEVEAAYPEGGTFKGKVEAHLRSGGVRVRLSNGDTQTANEGTILGERLPPKPSSMAGPGSPSITQGTEGQIYGVSQKAREQRAASGQVPEIGPGKGTTGEETVERGRQLLRQGFDAPAALTHFEQTKQISPDAAMAIRAYGEQLAKQMVHAEKTFGTTSPQFIEAYQAMAEWDKRTKPIATGAHELFTSLQGVTDIDTGTYSGLAREHKATTGRDFTPQQKKQAEGIAKTVQTTTEQADKARQALFNELSKGEGTETAPNQSKSLKSSPTLKEDVQKAFSGHRTGKAFTPEQVKILWKYAREQYIDKGDNDFGDLLSNVAADTGLDRSEVARALATPKGAKRLTNDMYKKMSDRRRAVQQAKWWLKQQQSPRWLQMLRSIPRAFFVAKVFGHGTVGMVTHAGMNVFNPAAWSRWFPAYVKQWELWLSSAKHEAWAQDIVRRPNFITARRAGLANDPFRYEDDYQNQFLGKWVSKFGGNRGFDALKDFRQNRFDQMWNKLPDSLKPKDAQGRYTEEAMRMAKAIADNVNHSTGIIRTTLPAPFQEIANWTLFAPKLEGSRWAWLVGDTAKTAATFKEWKNATPEQKYAAMADMRQKGTIIGVYYSLLIMNQGFLSATGSNQKINGLPKFMGGSGLDPTKSDFLQFKVAGYTIGIISPILGMVRLFANLYHDATAQRGRVESLSTRSSEESSTVGSYARGKASPVASFTADLLGQADFEGRPLPWSSDKTPTFLRREGLGPYTYPEYLSQTFSPIPLEALGPAVVKTVQDVWTDQGIPLDQQKALLNGILTFGIEGSTGIRFSKDYSSQK